MQKSASKDYFGSERNALVCFCAALNCTKPVWKKLMLRRSCVALCCAALRSVNKKRLLFIVFSYSMCNIIVQLLSGTVHVTDNV